ncbi:MAG: hypothetical protein AAGF93_07200 [Cyanobacteria bacterium P01_H01_bin.105]
MMYHNMLAEKEVFFDITPTRLDNDFRTIQAKNLTPISLDQLVSQLRTGVPLPEKPVVLTFDDGYSWQNTITIQLHSLFLPIRLTAKLSAALPSTGIRWNRN